jgi:hypothetical protein
VGTIDFKALNEAPATDGILEALRTEAIVAALDNCSEYCDGDCVMDSNGIGYEEAQLRAQGAVALNEALLRAARQLPESKVFAQVPTLSAAITDIIAERQRQRSVEGWTPEHDDEHRTGNWRGRLFVTRVTQATRTIKTWWIIKKRFPQPAGRGRKTGGSRQIRAAT